MASRPWDEKGGPLKNKSLLYTDLLGNTRTARMRKEKRERGRNSGVLCMKDRALLTQAQAWW